MSKFDDAIREVLQSLFEHGDVPDEDDFALFIDAIANGVEWHEHRPGGGPGSGTGDAAPLLPTMEEGELIRDISLDNLDAWRKLLTSHPHLAAEGLMKVWRVSPHGAACLALTCNPPHLYAGLSLTPAQVVKVNISDLEAVQTWTGQESEDDCRALVFDGQFLYAALATTPARVIKIAPSSMATVATWVGEEGQDNCQALTHDGTYLYVGLATDPAQVVQIRPASMQTRDVWEAQPGWTSCQALTFDGQYLYAGLNTDPARVVQIDPATMSTVVSWAGDLSQRYVRALAFDGSFVYAGLDTIAAQVVKIIRAGMFTADTWLGFSGEDRCSALAFDGESIHALLNIAPARVIQIDPTTMTAVRSQLVRPIHNHYPITNAITFDSLHLCFGGSFPSLRPSSHYGASWNVDPQNTYDGDPATSGWMWSHFSQSGYFYAWIVWVWDPPPSGARTVVFDPPAVPSGTPGTVAYYYVRAYVEIGHSGTFSWHYLYFSSDWKNTFDLPEGTTRLAEFRITMYVGGTSKTINRYLTIYEVYATL